MPSKNHSKQPKQAPHREKFSRQILHGNALNKRGIPSDMHHHDGMRKERKICFHREPKTLRSISMMEKSLLQEFTDGVVVGKWNKISIDSPRISRQSSEELKFTIPTSPNNRNIFENMVEHTTELKSQALQELRGRRASELEAEREIWLVD